MRNIEHLIAGSTWSGGSERTADVFNPALGKPIAKVRLADESDINHVVEVARAAQPAWGRTPPAKRASVMFAFRDLMNKHVDELAEMLSQEHGKTLADAKGELARGIEVIEFACGIPQLLKGEYNEQVAADIDSFAIRQPLGVVAGITPLTSQPWFRSGCIRYPLPVGMHLS